MKKIRWNKRYLTGDPKRDGRNKDLVALVAALAEELRKKEHCQEINEVTDRLSELTLQRLSRLPGDPEAAAESDATIRNLLKKDFPLASLSTPACRICGLCDLVEEKSANWLAEGSEEQNEPST